MGDGLGDMAFWLAIGGIGIAFWTAMMPIMKAGAARIANKSDDPERLLELEQRVADLEARVLTSGEVEAQFSRFDELEGRLDFTERLLTRTHEQAGSAIEEDG